MNIPKTPTRITHAPIIVNIHVQLLALLRSNAINPPNTASIATSGIIAFSPSAFPLLSLFVLSVSHALKAASFALEPKKVITQSSMITRDTPTAAADTAAGKRASIISARISTKERIDIPHRIYPAHINIFRFPILSDNAPIKIVVSVAATALAATIAEISAAVALNILYIKTFRYIFSTTQAI